MEQLFNAGVAVFIVLTMASAGFTTTFDQVKSVFKRPLLLALVLVVGIVIRPIVGWGGAEVFGLAIPAFIAVLITASAPGAPFGTKLVMNAGANVSSGAVLQVMLAVVMSFTFAPTANLLIEAADLGSDLTLPVGQILLTVVVLQLLPFLVGILMRHWTEDVALRWNEFSSKVAGVLFLFVLVAALLGSWQTLVDLLGDLVLLTAAVVAVVMVALGYFVSTGDAQTRRATGLIQPMTNTGPAFAAVAIAFDNDPAILGAMTGILLIQLVGGTIIASYFGKDAERQPQPAST